MKLATLALLSTSLAFGQWVATRPPSYVRLVPDDYFLSSRQTTETLVSVPTIKRSLFAFSRDYERTDNEPLVFLGPEAAQLQLEVLKRNWHPIDGNIWRQLSHVFKEGFANLGALNAATVYYRQYGLATTPSPHDPMAMRNYEREHDVIRRLYGPILKSLKGSAGAQLRHDLRKLLTLK
ncbi:MAG: hypothetical protein HY918_05755 [Candidatus Doudnabacteria bacterium]|nr:hypothetical protein [Candidatus Doudnabacteria bacterium]